MVIIDCWRYSFLVSQDDKVVEKNLFHMCKRHNTAEHREAVKMEFGKDTGQMKTISWG